MGDVERVMDRQSPWLDVKQAAAYLGFCERTIRRACQLGRLRCVRIGRSMRIRREWLDEWAMMHNS